MLACFAVKVLNLASDSVAKARMRSLTSQVMPLQLRALITGVIGPLEPTVLLERAPTVTPEDIAAHFAKRDMESMFHFGRFTSATFRDPFVRGVPALCATLTACRRQTPR